MDKVRKIQRLLMDHQQQPIDADVLQEMLDAYQGDVEAVLSLLGLLSDDDESDEGIDKPVPKQSIIVDDDDDEGDERVDKQLPKPSIFHDNHNDKHADTTSAVPTTTSTELKASLKAAVTSTSTAAVSAYKTAASASASVEDGSDQLVVISWNLNGISEEENLMPQRATAALREMMQHHPHVIMIQELTDEMENILTPKLISLGYTNLQPKPPDYAAHYYVTVYTRLPGEAVCRPRPFQTTSCMGRYLLNCAVTWQGKPLGLLTSHLESGQASVLANSPRMRVGQAQEVIKTLAKCSVGIFGGDTNLRVAEGRELEPLMMSSGVNDAWIQIGSPYASKYTWNMKTNDNLDIRNGPIMRLDQFWIKGLQCKSFQLIGTTRYGDIVKYPSDHYGILAKFAAA